MKTKITDLYMLMGRDLEPVDEVPAGNIFGESLILCLLSIIYLILCI